MRNFSRKLVGLAALATTASVLAIAPVASADPAGTAPIGAVTLTPSSGDSSTSFEMDLPLGAPCGGSGIDGYRFHTFLIPSSQDVNLVTFDAFGPSVGDTPFTDGFVQQRNRNPESSPVGLINSYEATHTMIAYDPGFRPAAGVYNIGVACTLSQEVTEFWVETITITDDVADTGAAGFTWTQGVNIPPDAPAITNVTDGNTECTVAFTPGTNADTHELTATPQGGGAPIVATGNSPLTVSGLANFTTYDLSLVATNGAGTSSAVTDTCSPSVVVQVQNLVATPGQESILVSWSAVVGASGYEVVSDTPDGTVTVTAPDASFDFTGLDSAVTYNFTVTPQGVAGAVGTSVSAQPNPNSLIYQTISVERPAGVLTLTQVCGEYGDLAVAPGVDSFPGFPASVAALAAAATTEANGGAPSTDPGFGDNDDPLFGSYPQFGSYPTWCDLDLGTATLITDGALAGQYYQATGRLNQVTVLDTRDDDAGWEVTGTQLDLLNGTEVLDGNYVGWQPQVNFSSNAVAPTAGPRVLPGSGIGSGAGLADGQPLATANAGEGLGLHRMDAHVQILIPVDADAGIYAGDLCLTII